MADIRNWRRATRLVRGGTRRSNFEETSEALFLTSGYVYKSAAEAEATFKNEIVRYQYSRFANPTVNMFEQRLAELEGAEICFATASGMSAVFAALMGILKQGDRVVASRALFGSCHFIVDQLLPRYGIEREFVDGTDLAQWEAALAKPTAAVLLETPSNPCLEIIDLKAVCDLANLAGARVVVDNVFATPILQRPLEYGASLAVYSTTKHIDGQGRCLGGAILTNDRELYTNQLLPFLRNTGPAMSPFNAWVMLKGLETLELRLERHCDNAENVARRLIGRRGVKTVLYPTLPGHPGHALAMAQMEGKGGGVVAFEVAGGKEAAFRFLDSLQMIDISNNLGDTKSLATHPATTTHQRLAAGEKAKLGITDGLIRLSVGLEDPQDIIEDIDQALKATL